MKHFAAAGNLFSPLTLTAEKILFMLLSAIKGGL